MAKPKIISSEPCEYRDVSCDFFGYQKWFREEISYSQVLEDLDMLVYLLKSSYAGYDDAVKRGLEIDNIIESFKKSNDDGKNIKVSDLSQFIYDFLKPYVQDSHFFIESKDFSKQLIIQHRVLYSNIYVKKVNDSFVVEKSDNQNIKSGDKFEGLRENLFAYPSAYDSVYRIGSLTSLEKKESVLNIQFSGIERNILCNVDTTHLYTDKLALYKEIETENSVYVFIPTFVDLDKSNPLKNILDENYKKLSSISERHSDKKYVILDLRTNGGGNDYYAFKFLSNLFYAEENCSDNKSKINVNKLKKVTLDEGDRIDYISPAIIQAENWFKNYCLSDDSNFLGKFDFDKKLLGNEYKRIAVKYTKKSKVKMKFPKFKGKLVILTGKNTASSGEGAVVYAKKMFSPSNQLITLGENSMGCMAYGNIFCYQFPNSGISLHMGAFSLNSETCPEGFGILPDYWATNEDIVHAIVNITGDVELSEKLKDINKL